MTNTGTAAIEIATFAAADDDTCGVRITWDGMAYVAEGIETGRQIARTASAEATIAHVGAYLISYGADADGDWSATVLQGRDLLADRVNQVPILAEARTMRDDA
jgi:hypothetical protein